MPSRGQGFIGRNRPPRVHITYEDPYDAEELVELPFVMGVMADLSGNASGTEKAEVSDRTFSNLDMDNFSQFMASIDPGVAMAVANQLDPESKEKLMVKLNFKSMDDFSPAAVARAVPATAKLLEAREQLQHLLRFMDGKTKASNQIRELLQDPALMEELQKRTGGGAEGAAEPAETKADE
ncbi:MAG: type VI secretion system contractile sheath small subunit [Pseudomonadota bacterium]